MDATKKQEEIIFRSKLPNIYIPDHLPLHDYCLENLNRFKDRPFLINGVDGQIFTYSEVDKTARKIGTGLHKLGIRKGDVIMILLKNSPEFVFFFIGAMMRGAITTTANPFHTPPEIAKQAISSKAKLIVTHSCFVDKVRELVRENDVKIVTVDFPVEGCLHISELTQSEESEAPVVEIVQDDVVALPYSSGTTGLPKGVMVTHKGLVTSIAQQVDGKNPNLYMHEHDVILCFLPLFHIYSLNTLLLCGMRVGAALLIMQKFEINSAMQLMDKYKVTIAPLVPPVVLALTKCEETKNYDLSSIRMVISGGAPMRKELEDAVRVKLPNATLGQGYGMTEAGCLSLCLAFAKEPFEIKSGACGTVIRNAEMKIISIDTGISLPPNQSGEICIRGNQLMKGYIDDPKSTNETIDKDGWLHTGDIGYIDNDDELFIVDRIKELIKHNGYQVAPAELESLLLSHPGISDAGVAPMEDEAAGEVPVAFVVRSNGSKISEDEIKQYVSEQVIYYKRLARVFLTDSIPKSPAGKILRKELKAIVASTVRKL